MNADTLKGQWLQLKGKVKTQWGKLTDDEIDQIDGNLDQLAGKVQERYGKKRDEVERELERMCTAKDKECDASS